MRGESKIEIGGVARAHGIRGEIVVVTHDPDSDTLGSLASIYIGGVERKIVQARGTQRGWLIALEGVITRNDAEALQGKPVEVDRDDLELGAGEVLLHDMVGLEVRLVDGTPWGRIFAVDPGEFQDLIVIHAPAPDGPDGPVEGEVERLVPLVDAFVKNVDLAAGIVTLDPPQGIPESRVKRK